MVETRHIFTWANGLSAARLAATPPCACAISTSSWAMAAALFIFAVLTDLLDGPIARRRGEVSALGGFVDHATDAFFCAVTLGALALAGIVPAVLPFLVAGAFFQYAADSKALTGRLLRTSLIGRSNGIAYFVLAGIPIIRNALGLAWPMDALILGIGWALVLTTVVSVLDRLRALLTK